MKSGNLWEFVLQFSLFYSDSALALDVNRLLDRDCLDSVDAFQQSVDLLDKHRVHLSVQPRYWLPHPVRSSRSSRRVLFTAVFVLIRDVIPVRRRTRIELFAKVAAVHGLPDSVSASELVDLLSRSGVKHDQTSAVHALTSQDP